MGDLQSRVVAVGIGVWIGDADDLSAVQGAS
jgi:hypothetical protein